MTRSVFPPCASSASTVSSWALSPRRARALAHPDRGRILLIQMAERLKEIAAVERPPLLEGHQMIMVMGLLRPGQAPAVVPTTSFIAAPPPPPTRAPSATPSMAARAAAAAAAAAPAPAPAVPRPIAVPPATGAPRAAPPATGAPRVAPPPTGAP